MSKAKEMLNILEKLEKGVVILNNTTKDTSPEKKIGYVKVGSNKVPFTTSTKFGKGASFETLTVGTKVRVETRSGGMGMHASVLELV